MGFHHQVQPLLQFVERWLIQDSPETGLLRRVVSFTWLIRVLIQARR